MKKTGLIAALLLVVLYIFIPDKGQKQPEILNVSYDPTREFFVQYNKMFIEHWKELSGQEIEVKQSHGGSGKQARSVIEGLRADVVTLALAYDIDVIAKKGKLLPENWQETLPNNSCPYVSTIVFLVRKGNPKNIRDWNDLIKDDIQVITPNPKTSGGARWNYMAAWAYASEKFSGDEEKIKEFMKMLFRRVPVLDSGARGSSITFARRAIGDVLISWENEAFLSKKEIKEDSFEMIYPSVSILAEPPVAVIEKNTIRKNTENVAREYLNFLYSDRAQELAAQNFFRPSNKDIAGKYNELFPSIRMANIADFGGWQKVQKEHFDDGGIFDQIYGSE